MAPRRTVERARGLRRAMTMPEVRLWAILRGRPRGFRFRRQHPIGPFVLDFYCPAARLAIEIDGASHDFGDRPQSDDARDHWLQGQGVATLRMPARDVIERLDDVVAAILQRIACPLHHPADGPPPHAVHGEDAE
jgi:very-short-patch-repair endonuclease